MLCWDIWRVQTSVLLKFYGPLMCRNRPDFGNVIPITRFWPDCFTFCKTCHVIYLYWYFKIVNWKWTVSVEIHNNSSLLSGTRYEYLSWIYEVMSSYDIYIYICHNIFFICMSYMLYTKQIGLPLKKCSASEWKHAIDIACVQPFMQNCIHRLVYIYILYMCGPTLKDMSTMWPNHLSYWHRLRCTIWSYFPIIDTCGWVKCNRDNGLMWTKLSHCLIIIARVYECSATLPPHSQISVHESKAFPCCLTLDIATM